MKTYPDVRNGQWVRPIRRGYKSACCDCELVHRMDFRLNHGHIEFRLYRDQRATGQLRRWRHVRFELKDRA